MNKINFTSCQICYEYIFYRISKNGEKRYVGDKKFECSKCSTLICHSCMKECLKTNFKCPNCSDELKKNIILSFISNDEYLTYKHEYDLKDERIFKRYGILLQKLEPLLCLFVDHSPEEIDKINKIKKIADTIKITNLEIELKNFHSFIQTEGAINKFFEELHVMIDKNCDKCFDLTKEFCHLLKIVRIPKEIILKRLSDEFFNTLDGFEKIKNRYQLDKKISSLLAETNKPIMRCVCGGVVLENYKCTRCLSEICSQCGEIKKDTHECDLEKQKDFNFILETSRTCPNCLVRITKSQGCDEMFCTHCGTGFRYHNGEIINYNFHNPHRQEWLEKQVSTLPDIDCGEIYTFELIQNSIFENLYKYMMFIKKIINENIEDVQNFKIAKLLFTDKLNQILTDKSKEEYKFIKFEDRDKVLKNLKRYEDEKNKKILLQDLYKEIYSSLISIFILVDQMLIKNEDVMIIYYNTIQLIKEYSICSTSMLKKYNLTFYLPNCFEKDDEDIDKKCFKTFLK